MYFHSDLEIAYKKLNLAYAEWNKAIYVDDGQTIYHLQTKVHQSLDNYLKIERWLVDDNRASDATAFKQKLTKLTKRKTLLDNSETKSNAKNHFN